MSVRIRKLVGTFALIALVLIWALLAMAVAQFPVIKASSLGETIYYVVAGLAQANTRYSLDTSAADSYRQGMATSLSQSTLHILDRYLNVLPTFTIREGHRIKVYLAEDLLLPAYERHEIPGDL